MESVVGIFTTRAEAEGAIGRLKSTGIADDHINFLTPGNPEQEVSRAPTTEAEQAGPGEAIGGVVGGALGAAGGMTLGAAAATMFVPGVGSVFALGLLGASIFGAGGAVGGAVIGKALESGMDEGVAADELFVYEDALRQGRSIVIVLTDDDEKARMARQLLRDAQAESVDSAREMWWIGLRDAEKEHYTAHGGADGWDEPVYRRGFEAALHPAARGKNYGEVAEQLAARYPDDYNREAFRRGYERGQAHYRSLTESIKASHRKAERSA